MRTSDLARSAGVSTQTVRNLESRSVLPPADRTDSGYRRYTQQHLLALLAYTDLSAAFGPAAAGQIVGLVNTSDHDAAVDEALRLAAHLHRDGELIHELRGTFGRPPQSSVVATLGSRSITEVARHLGVRPSTLRVWERESLLAPARDQAGHRVYQESDVQTAITVQALRGAGLGLPQIRAILEHATTGATVQDLFDALDQRARQVRARKRLSARAMGSLHRCLEASQPELINMSSQSS